MTHTINDFAEMRTKFVNARDVHHDRMNKAQGDRFICRIGNSYLVRLTRYDAEFAGIGEPKLVGLADATDLFKGIPGVEIVAEFAYEMERRDTCIDAIAACNDRIAELTAQAPQA